jgi:hypothetical protein
METTLLVHVSVGDVLRSNSWSHFGLQVIMVAIHGELYCWTQVSLAVSVGRPYLKINNSGEDCVFEMHCPPLVNNT